MAPPSELSGFESAIRVCGGCFVCGSTTPLVYTTLLQITSPATSYLLVLLLSAVSLCYLGVRRAAITHMGKRHLAAQTASLLFPCLILARLAGSRWLSHLAQPSP